MKIVIETIPHSEQRYPTCGDYWQDPDGTYQVRVSQLSSQARMSAIIEHELSEMLAVIAADIPFFKIDQWDDYICKYLPKEREPGDIAHAPYYRQHQMATIIERIFIEHVGDKWQEYEQEIENL